MSIADLFLRESTEQDVSLISLPQDLDLWPETIISHVKEKLPDTKDMAIRISFLKKDEEQGVATGSVEITNKKINKTLYLPLIAKNFKMFPLDIYMVPDETKESSFETRPLTRRAFEEYFFNNRVFDSVTKPLDKLRNLYNGGQENLIMPPTYRNVHASAQVIDSLVGSISKEDIESFKDTVRSDQQALIGYEKRANLDVLKKIFNIKTAEEPTPALKNISIIKKDSPSRFKVVSVSDQAFDPIVEEIDKEELLYNLDDKVERPEDIIHEVESNGERMVFDGLSPKDKAIVYGGPKPENFQKVEDKPKPATIFGSYKVQDKNGVYHKGVVIPNMIDFNMKVLPHKVFINPQMSAFQTDILGVAVEEDHPMKTLKFRDPKVGVTGVFVYHNETNAIATYPVTIRSILDKPEARIAVVEKLDGTTIKLKLNDYSVGINDENFIDLAKIVHLGDKYLMPSKFKFVPMENLVELTNDPYLYGIKEAAKRVSTTPVRVIYTGASQFGVKGPDMRKMASQLGWDVTNLNPTQTVFLLAAKKCPLDKIATCLKLSSKEGESSVHGLPDIKWNTEHKKTASEDISKMKCNLYKEASFFEDSQVVDNVLSLNFINPENVNKFVNFIPLFKHTSNMLAQTLLAARLGMTEIPPEATSTAMTKLVEVIDGLEKMRLQVKED